VEPAPEIIDYYERFAEETWLSSGCRQDGHHFNESRHPEYFTTAYCHRPEDLRLELEHAGFDDVFRCRWARGGQKGD
jgi:hypothetical protein